MLMKPLALATLAAFAMPATAQTGVAPGTISGLNSTGPGTGEFHSMIDRGADPKEWQQRRLARVKAILAANPEATERLASLGSKRERIQYMRALDRKTPGYGGTAR